MPVKIGPFEEPRRRKARDADPALMALLDAVARDTPVRVPLAEGPSARVAGRHQPGRHRPRPTDRSRAG